MTLQLFCLWLDPGIGGIIYDTIKDIDIDKIDIYRERKRRMVAKASSRWFLSRGR